MYHTIIGRTVPEKAIARAPCQLLQELAAETLTAPPLPPPPPAALSCAPQAASATSELAGARADSDYINYPAYVMLYAVPRQHVRAVNPRPRGPWPVSYTHLTLPTNREV